MQMLACLLEIPLGQPCFTSLQLDLEQGQVDRDTLELALLPRIQALLDDRVQELRLHAGKLRMLGVPHQQDCQSGFFQPGRIPSQSIWVLHGWENFKDVEIPRL